MTLERLAQMDKETKYTFENQGQPQTNWWGTAQLNGIDDDYRAKKESNIIARNLLKRYKE